MVSDTFILQLHNFIHSYRIYLSNGDSVSFNAQCLTELYFSWDFADFSCKRQIFLELDLRSFQLPMLSYNTGRTHESLPAWWAASVSKIRQFSPNSRAHVSVDSRPPAPILGPSCTEDCNSWDGKISIQVILICADTFLFCVSLNQQCLIDLMGRRAS